MNEQWRMVKEFHQRFGHLVNDAPTPLTDEQRRERYWFMYEELQEFLSSSSVSDQADAMIDLIYFALGTLVNMGVTPEHLFAIVHQANMSKLWPDGKPRWREEDGKVLKPPGWVSPDEAILAEIERQRGGADEDLPNVEKALAYYKAGVRQSPAVVGWRWPRPPYVPTRIRLLENISGELGILAFPGDYDCTCNKFGAVSIDVDGRKLGIAPHEFEVLAWGKNAKKDD